MPMTSEGQTFIKEAGPGKLFDYGRRSLDVVSRAVRRLGVPTRAISKHVAEPIAKASAKAGDAAVRATGNVGNFVYDNPRLGVPLVGATAYGAYRIPQELNKQLYHVDPNMNITETRNAGLPIIQNYLSTGMESLQYKSPELRDMYAHQKLITKGV